MKVVFGCGVLNKGSSSFQAVTGSVSFVHPPKEKSGSLYSSRKAGGLCWTISMAAWTSEPSITTWYWWRSMSAFFLAGVPGGLS